MTKKTKNLLYGKLLSGFPGLAAVLLLLCSLVFVSCGEEDDDIANATASACTLAEAGKDKYIKLCGISPAIFRRKK